MSTINSSDYRASHVERRVLATCVLTLGILLQTVTFHTFMRCSIDLRFALSLFKCSVLAIAVARPTAAMDSVPYKFCDSVVASLSRLPDLDAPFPSNLWKAALKDHVAKRQFFEFHVTCVGDQWFYVVRNTERNEFHDFDVLQAVDPRYPRIIELELFGSSGPSLFEVSFDDLAALMERLKCFLNLPDLYIGNKCLQDNKTERFLRLLEQTQFFSVWSSVGHKVVISFIKQMMRSRSRFLKRITSCDFTAHEQLTDEVTELKSRFGENNVKVQKSETRMTITTLYI